MGTIKKAQNGDKTPKGYVRGEMTGKLYKKSVMDKWNKSFAKEMADAAASSKKPAPKKPSPKKPPVTKKKEVYHGPPFKDGGKAFPDLNKDGKVTKADVLVGRGVIKAKKGINMKKAQSGASLRSGQLKRIGRLAAKNPDRAKKVASRMVERDTRKARGKAYLEKNISELMPKSRKGSNIAKCKYGCK